MPRFLITPGFAAVLVLGAACALGKADTFPFEGVTRLARASFHRSNPAMRVAAVPGTMRDKDGRANAAGNFGRIKNSDADRKVPATTSDAEGTVHKCSEFAAPELVGGMLQGSLRYPSSNERGKVTALVAAKPTDTIREKASSTSTCARRPCSRPHTSWVRSSHK